MRRAGLRSLVLLALVAIVAACNANSYAPPSPSGSAPLAPGQGRNAAGCAGAVCDAGGACGDDRRCVQGVCLPDNGTCKDDDQCLSDTRCYQNACVPYGLCTDLPAFDPACRTVLVREELFPPEPGCRFAGPRVLSVPLVLDLDRSTNKDGKSEILFLAHPGTLYALRSDCQLLFRKDVSALSSGQTSLAAADLDGDGRVEIVTLDAAARVAVFDDRGELLATAPSATPELSTYGQALWSAPTLADIDGKPGAEIIAGAQVLRYQPGSPPSLQVLWQRTNRTAFFGSVPVVADLDGDGKPEVITSDQIYDGLTGSNKTPPLLSAKPFYAQVGDFNGDGEPELVLVESEPGRPLVRIYEVRSRRTLFGPYDLPGGGYGGPAVIADFDGDSVPDFGVASAGRYTVFALRCARDPRPADCQGLGILWSKATSDHSSGGSGSTVFDLNGDGAAEVLYRDECWLRVSRGADGRTLFAVNITSNTALEYPVVADLDGDGHAEVVVASDDFGACQAQGQAEAETGAPWSGLTSGIHVLRNERWIGTRGVWNQHAYHITNINDDLTVPVMEAPSWRRHNSYRQNLQRLPTAAAPDLTSRQIPVPDDPSGCGEVWNLSGEICNRGAGPAAAPVPGAFYDGDPDQGGRLICVGRTSRAIPPGGCEVIGCAWQQPAQGKRDIYLRAGDDGQGLRALQCRSGNDLSIDRGTYCGRLPG